MVEEGWGVSCGLSKVLLWALWIKKMKRLKFLCVPSVLQEGSKLQCAWLSFPEIPLHEMGTVGGGTPQPTPSIPLPPVPSRAGGECAGWLIAWGGHLGRAELSLLICVAMRSLTSVFPPTCAREERSIAICLLPAAGREGVGIQLPRHHSIQPRLTASGANWPRLDSCFYRLFALWYWTSALTSPGFSDPSTQTNGVKPTHS